MESLQTSCPNCGSTFKISQQQLNAAGGHVRCGSCRQVFDAQSRAVNAEAPIATHSINQKSGRNTLEGEIGEFSQSFLELNKTGQGTSPFLDMSDLDKSLAEKEEAWTQALLDDDDNTEPLRPKVADYLSVGANSLKSKVNESISEVDNSSTASPNRSSSAQQIDELNLGDIDLDEVDMAKASSEKRGVHSLDDFLAMSEADKASPHPDSGITAKDDFDLLQESEMSRSVDEYSDTFEDKLDALFGPDSFDKNDSTQSALDSHTPIDDPFAGLDEDTLSSQPAHKAALIQQIQADPLELNLPSKRWKKLKAFGWAMLALVLLCMPLVQYLYFNFNELSQQANFRPLFTQACDKLGCQLPPQEDISQIKTGNLVVRSHPEEIGALAIDAVITNRAAYSQPFPALELLFTDAQGAVVAARSFQPSEYLKGELTGAKLMKQRQPVHVALSIKDPGDQAVGYALQLKPTQ